MISKIILALFGSYFILKPFYFWESGLPQISDLILITAIILFVTNNKMKICIFKGSKPYIALNSVFVLYILFINSVWALILNGELSFYKVSMYYLFNFISLVAVISLSGQYSQRLYKLLYYTASVSTILQFIIILLNGGFSGNREMAFFNNPNQLGYHSVLTLALILFLSEEMDVNCLWFTTLIFLLTVLCLVSLSKAAIISFFGMLLFYLLLRIRSRMHVLKSGKMFLIPILLAIAIPIVYRYYNEVLSSNPFIEGVKFRLSTIGQSKDDSLAQRGYDRLIRYPQYLVFGAGEGVYSRFGSMIEIHSTLGNILMSYGIIGITLYSAILIDACRCNSWRNLYIIGFTTLYGITHNGVRNTLFWILTALIYSSGFRTRNNESGDKK